MYQLSLSLHCNFLSCHCQECCGTTGFCINLEAHTRTVRAKLANIREDWHADKSLTCSQWCHPHASFVLLFAFTVLPVLSSTSQKGLLIAHPVPDPYALKKLSTGSTLDSAELLYFISSFYSL